MLIRMNKAFDTMDHHVLLDKLNYYGFRGIINQWFFSYLATRAQTTEIDFYLSHKQNVTCGVPQGSPRFTNVLYPHKNLKTLESIANTELHNLFNWLTSNKRMG